MTIIRCKKCRIVVFDSNEDCERDFQCMECGRTYHIKMVNGETVNFDMLKSDEKALEVFNA